MIIVKRINVERVIHEDDLQRYTEQGYRVIEDKKNDEDTPVENAEVTDLNDMTVDQLKTIAKERALADILVLLKRNWSQFSLRCRRSNLWI